MFPNMSPHITGPIYQLSQYLEGTSNFVSQFSLFERNQGSVDFNTNCPTGMYFLLMHPYGWNNDERRLAQCPKLEFISLFRPLRFPLNLGKSLCRCNPIHRSSRQCVCVCLYVLSTCKMLTKRGESQGFHCSRLRSSLGEQLPI